MLTYIDYSVQYGAPSQSSWPFGDVRDYRKTQLQSSQGHTEYDSRVPFVPCGALGTEQSSIRLSVGNPSW